MGVFFAILIMVSWLVHLFWSLLFVDLNIENPFLYLHILIQIFLSTGLFITAHDAMHQSVSKSKRMNWWIGNIATHLYAAMSYKKLKSKHFLHHRHSGTNDDPDYSSNNQFFVWWFRFVKQYVTIGQIFIMAILFNVLLIWFSNWSLILLWILPAILSIFQLFYFGTYLPHKKPHTNLNSPHNARSQRRNHLFAFLSCYFFGYHLEHHVSPGTPWWKLYQEKNDCKHIKKSG